MWPLGTFFEVLRLHLRREQSNCTFNGMFTIYIYILILCLPHISIYYLLAAVHGIVVESVGSLRFSLTPKVLAIIGGSGAGKTTLLDTALSSAFRNKNDSGLRPIKGGVSEDVLSMLSMSLASVSAHYCS